MRLSRTLTTAALTAATLTTALTATLAGVSPATASTTTASDAERAARPAPRVLTISTNKEEVVQGGRVIIRGRVTSGPKGGPVRLQVRYDGAWKSTDLKDTVDKRGRFQLVDKVSSAQTRDYRVVAPRDKVRRAARSAPVTVVVWSWRDLGSLPAVRAEATRRASNLPVNGATYPSALVATGGNAGGMELNVSRRCRELRTQVGLADYSTSNTSGTVTLRTDGTQRFAGTFGVGQSSEVVFSLKDVFRLGFDWTSSNPAGTPADQSGAFPALGGPQVLCRD